jgi:hypothetical protein
MMLFGVILSVVVTVSLSALYPVLRSRGFLKDPVRNVGREKTYTFITQAGNAIAVLCFEDLLVTACVVSEGDDSFVSTGGTRLPPFSNALLERVYDHSISLASKSKGSARQEPFGVLYGFGFPFCSACFETAIYSPHDYGHISWGFSVYPNWNKSVLTSPFNFIVPYSPIWNGFVGNAIFWTATCFIVRWIALQLSRKRRNSTKRPLPHQELQ